MPEQKRLSQLDENKLLKFIESKLHIPYVNLDDYDLDIKCLDYISFNDVLKYKVIFTEEHRPSK